MVQNEILTIIKIRCMVLLATHAAIILILLWSAITLHLLTLKIKKDETQKRQKRQPKKVLHSKQRWSQIVIDETPTHTQQK